MLFTVKSRHLVIAAFASFASLTAFGQGKPVVSGIEPQTVDPTMRAADDFYTRANGKWLAETTIPADKPSWNPGYVLHEDAQEKLRIIIEEAAAAKAAKSNGESRKVGDLYRSFMDEARLETLKLKPLADEFAAIDRIKDKAELPALFARLRQIGVSTPVDLDIDQDKRNSTAYITYLSQGGLGLPDRDYYIDDSDAKLVDIRKKYGEHIAKMLSMMGSKNAKKEAAEILALETAIARIHWTKVENRDPVKTYQKITIKELPAFAPGFDWTAYLAAAGVSAKVSDVVLYQASYLKAFASLFATTPLPVWKDYFRW